MEHNVDILVKLLRAKRPDFYAQFDDKTILAAFDEKQIDRLILNLRKQEANG